MYLALAFAFNSIILVGFSNHFTAVGVSGINIFADIPQEQAGSRREIPPVFDEVALLPARVGFPGSDTLVEQRLFVE